MFQSKPYKARLHLFLGVLAVFALALPAPALASIQLHSPYGANRDWLVGKTKTIGSLTTTLNYTNDVAGNVVALKSSTANGTLVYYQWDALNRLAGVSGPMVGQTTYSYNGAGSLAGYTYPNSVATAYQYDSLNRLTNQVASRGTNVASYAYTLGAAGQRTGVVELNARAVSYAYDPLYRLTGETVGNDPVGSNGGIGYTFDSVGNRLARSSNIAAVPTATHSYTANDWLTSDSYDSNGNTVNAGGIPDTYDFENRLVTHLYGQIAMVYDGDGNRVKKTASGMSTYYVVDDRNPTGYAQVIEELIQGYSGAPALQRVYTHGHALISQDQLVNGQWVRSYYGQDGHGSVRYLTDGQGNVTDAYAYDAFGVLIRATGGTPNSYLYCGEQYDVSLGLYYLRARYANPKTGRFWNMDSFEGGNEDPKTLHKYLYCRGNPANRIDPSGHFDCSLGGLVSSMGSILNSASLRFAGLSAAKRWVVLTVGTVIAWEGMISLLSYDPKNKDLIRSIPIAKAIIETHKSDILAYAQSKNLGYADTSALPAFQTVKESEGFGYKLVKRTMVTHPIRKTTYVSNDWLEEDEPSTTEIVSTFCHEYGHLLYKHLVPLEGPANDFQDFMKPFLF